MILLDTSGLLAAMDADEERHAACREVIAASAPRLLSPFVLAEVDYLLATHVGSQQAIGFLDDVVAGAYRLEPFGAADVRRAREVMRRHLDLDLGLADASIVVLAERQGVADVLTLDERHFRVVTRDDGTPFRVLPADVG